MSPTTTLGERPSSVCRSPVETKKKGSGGCGVGRGSDSRVGVYTGLRLGKGGGRGGREGTSERRDPTSGETTEGKERACSTDVVSGYGHQELDLVRDLGGPGWSSGCLSSRPPPGGFSEKVCLRVHDDDSDPFLVSTSWRPDVLWGRMKFSISPGLYLPRRPSPQLCV